MSIDRKKNIDALKSIRKDNFNDGNEIVQKCRKDPKYAELKEMNDKAKQMMKDEDGRD